MPSHQPRRAGKGQQKAPRPQVDQAPQTGPDQAAPGHGNQAQQEALRKEQVPEAKQEASEGQQGLEGQQEQSTQGPQGGPTGPGPKTLDTPDEQAAPGVGAQDTGKEGEEKEAQQDEEALQEAADKQEEKEAKKGDGDDGGDGDADAAPADAAPADAGGAAGAAPADAGGAPSAPAGGGAPAGPSGAPGGGLTTMSQEKGGRLSRWDDEVAWSDYFKLGDASGKELQVDRGALIADALAGGAWAGFKSGAQALVIDTVVNTALSRVPMVSGFLEMARIAYDPEAYLQGLLQSTAGKAVQGIEKIMTGDPITVIEGILDLLSSVSSVIGTLANICWIAASLGFLAGLFCPAILPFVALAAQWGTTLGTVGAVMGLVVALMQAGVASLRALEIALSDANPAELLERGESLRTQTQGFVSGYTARAGANLRNRGAAKLQERGKARRQGDNYKPPEKTPSVDPPSRMDKVHRVLGFATGNLGNDREGNWGGGTKNVWSDAKKSVQTGVKVTQAYRGTGDYAQGGAVNADGNRTTMQRIADIQSAGGNVFHDQRHRDRTLEKLANGEGSFKTREEGHVQAREAVTSAQNRHTRNKERVRLTRAKRSQKQAELEEAQANLQRVRAEHGDEVAAMQGEVAQRQDLYQSYRQDRAATEAGLTSAREHRSLVAAYNRAHPSKQYKAMLDEADTDVRAWESRVGKANADEQEALTFLTEGQGLLTRAQAPIQNAQESADRATRMGALSERLYGSAKNDTKGSRRGYLDARRAAEPYDSVDDGRTLEAHEAWEASHTPFYKVDENDQLIRDENGEIQRDFLSMESWGQAVQGKGASGAYGVKKSNARLLSTDIVKGNLRQQEAEAAGEESSGGPLGLWSATTDDKAIDWKGQSGRGEGSYQGQLEGMLENLKASLPMPPKAGPVKVDGAALAWGELEAEQETLRSQKAETQVHQQAAAQEAQAADGVNALAQKNAAQAQAQQQGLADKQSKQSELSKQSAVTKQNFDQSGAKAGQGQGLVGGFIGKFMSLMSMIPSRLMGDSGEGSSGAKKLQSGVDGAGKGSAAGQQAVQQAQAAGSQFSADTANANTQAQEVGSQMGTLTGQVQTDKAAALQGQADLQSAEGEIDTKIDSMEADQGRLAAEHDGWVATMLNWTTSHEALRKKGMGELEGIVTLVDTKS